MSVWHETANYIYDTQPKNGESHITFYFPNAASGDLTFTTWLYKYREDGEIIEKNLTAEMLQCYIDKDTKE